MNGKIVLCFAVVLVGQAMSAALFEEDVKKIGDQFTQTAASIGSHMSTLLGMPTSSADAQKSIEKAKSLVTKGLADLEEQATKLKAAILKDQDVDLVNKINEIEKNLKSQATNAKEFLSEKVSKPIDEKFKDDVKKFSELVVKNTKEFESTVNKAIDSKKKQ